MVERRGRLGAALAIALGAVAAPMFGQESVSNTGCLPGDAVSPWSASEQCNQYVVDLTPFQTSWGTTFGIAPIIKSSKTTSQVGPMGEFFGSLISAQAMSRTQRTNVTLGGSYAYWNTAGPGINDDQNTAPMSISPTGTGNQFAVAFSEFATTDFSLSYNGIVGGIVQYKPTEPTRLYVKRVLAAANGCEPFTAVSQMGLGSVDADGNVVFRADDFLGANTGTGTGCSPNLADAVEDNIFRVRMANRTCNAKNVISNSYPTGTNATDWLVRNSVTTHNTPAIVPSATMGGTSLFIGSNFNNEYVRGENFGAITADNSHFPAGVAAHRGNVSWTSYNCAALGTVGNPPTRGAAALVALDATDDSRALIVFGLDNSGNVVNKRALTLPATFTTDAPGAVTFPTADVPTDHRDEFDNYHGTVAFRGGNGQVALGRDQAGRLLAAAQVSHPGDMCPSAGCPSGPRDWRYDYIAVARLNCDTGGVEWALAAYTDVPDITAPFTTSSATPPILATGKQILDGPNGAVIGRLTQLQDLTGGTPRGPSLSSPMIDSVGNVWFVGVVFLPDEVDQYDTALLRAVYNPATFSYQLEMILRTGDVFTGANTGLNYQISFITTANNAGGVSSGNAWSQNISETAHNNANPAGLQTRSPDTLGGLILNAEITYDRDNDMDFATPCTSSDLGDGDADQEYNVILYIGSVTANATGFPCVSASDCRNDVADNGCNHATCTGGACRYACVRYGDVAPFPGGNRIVNLDDILCVLAGFANPTACPNADIAPCEGNLIINLDDILAVLGAFAGGNPCGCTENSVPGTGVAPLCGSNQP